jgi:hypothetical protein
MDEAMTHLKNFFLNYNKFYISIKIIFFLWTTVKNFCLL